MALSCIFFAAMATCAVVQGLDLIPKLLPTELTDLKPNISDLISETAAKWKPSSSWADLLPAADNLVEANLDRLRKGFDDFDEDLRNKMESIFKSASSSVLEDSLLDVSGLAAKYGYPCEEHTVHTDDGYVLTMHRLPFGRNGPTSEKRPVLFLQHGLLCSSADWIIAGPEKSLAYLAADIGFDVWMGNARGNTYSRKHTHLSPEHSKFWDFSWHEIAVYDMPAMIDYVLKTTEHRQLSYAGHSQGTTVFYILCSEKPQYNDKFKVSFSLAPIAFMDHMTSPFIRLLSPVGRGIEVLLKTIGVNEFLPSTTLLRESGKILCDDNSAIQVLCSNALFVICGFNQKQMNETLLPTLVAHTPAGSSTKQLLHYGQEVVSGKFRQWDYGSLSNLKHYNSIHPPDYELSNIIAPVYLFYSRNDWLSNEVDVLRLYDQLKNPVGKMLVEDKDFNHLDYLYGIDARELVYDKLIGMLVMYL